MRLKDILEMLFDKQKVRIKNSEHSGEDIVYEGLAKNTPYWIAEWEIERGSYDGWYVDEEGYLNIYTVY